MQSLSLNLIWAGDLDDRKKNYIMQNTDIVFEEPFYPPKMTVNCDKETMIGRKNTRITSDYILKSALSNRMISKKHVVIKRLIDGNYVLSDHSKNGTYHNYSRVTGAAILRNDDIICFGHINGSNIKPGEKVNPFCTDLKYRVEIIEKKIINRLLKCEQYSSSSDEVIIKNQLPTESVRSLRKTKVLHHSSDSSDSSIRHDNNKYFKKKKIRHITDISSSEEDHQKPTKTQDRSIYKKSNKRVLSVKENNFQSSRSQKSRFLQKNSTELEILKSNYPKKSHVRLKLEDVSQIKDRKMHNISHKNCHSKNKHKNAQGKSVMRNNNVNSNDYEVCKAKPCRRPGGDNPIDWILCDICNQWFHQFCVDLDEALEDEENYYCPYCSNS